MAKCFQPDRKEEFDINSRNDLFIRCENGGTIRITVNHNGVTILPINGVTQQLAVVNGCAGITFNCPASSPKKPYYHKMPKFIKKYLIEIDKVDKPDFLKKDYFAQKRK